MRAATLITIVLLASCRSQHASIAQQVDTLGLSHPTDSLLQPRLVTGPTVIVFWLAGADSFPADDQAAALDELNFATEGIAPVLARHNISLVPTNSDSVYVALPNRQRRLILLAGADYPFGYLLVEPGTSERVLAGVYADEELLDEIEAYFNLPAETDSTRAGPRIST